jgi:hypothetical protein
MIQPYPREKAVDEPNLYQKRIEIYLDTCSIRGVLETAQARVSDHLNAFEDTIRLTDARVILREGTPLSTESTVYINRSIVLFVVDLTPQPAGQDGLHVQRDERPVTFNIGTIWIRGRAHLPVGGEMQTFVGEPSDRFMPITEATVVGYEATAPRTILINRDQLRCMMA